MQTHLSIHGQAAMDELLQQQDEPSPLQGVAVPFPGCLVHPQGPLKSLHSSCQSLQQPVTDGMVRMCGHVGISSTEMSNEL